MLSYFQIKRKNLLILALGIIAGYLIARFSVFQLVFTEREVGEKIEVTDFESILNNSIVILAFGQSNSANYGLSRMGYFEGVYNYHHGRLYKATDPLIGADGVKGSVWTRLGKKIIETQKARNVIFITIGVGDSSIYRWSRYGDLHNKLLYALKSAEDGGLNIEYILWHQGETDANIFKTSGEDYRKLFKDVTSSIRNYVDAPIFVSIATRIKDSVPNEIIRNAQIELARGSNIFQGPDTDQLDESYRYDGTHFNDGGLDKISELWMQSLFGS